MVINRFDVFLVNLDPTIGSEVKKTRPCIVVSPQELNDVLNTVIIVPLTSKISNYPMRVKVKVNDTEGEAMLDHIRAVDKKRLVKKITHIRGIIQDNICDTLSEMFTK